MEENRADDIEEVDLATEDTLFEHHRIIADKGKSHSECD